MYKSKGGYSSPMEAKAAKKYHSKASSTQVANSKVINLQPQLHKSSGGSKKMGSY